MAELLAHTPLEGQRYSVDGLSIKELDSCAKINIRGNVADLTIAVEGILGPLGSLESNRFISTDTSTLFWLGPDECLLYCADGNTDALLVQLKEKLPGNSAMVDVSDYYTVIRVAGAKARAVLSSGTPFDVHPRVFGPGQCAQTRFGNASILLRCINDETYDIQVRWSFAEYVWEYLRKVGGYI